MLTIRRDGEGIICPEKAYRLLARTVKKCNFAPDMESPRLIALPRIADMRGDLTYIEDMAQVPFGIERVYWLTGVASGDWRHGHAYRSQTELIVALSGSFTVATDSVSGPRQWVLDSPAEGLLLPSLTWRVLHRFSANAVALVVSSGGYDEDEYIRSRDEYDQLIGRGR